MDPAPAHGPVHRAQSPATIKRKLPCPSESSISTSPYRFDAPFTSVRSRAGANSKPHTKSSGLGFDVKFGIDAVAPEAVMG